MMDLIQFEEDYQELSPELRAKVIYKDFIALDALASARDLDIKDAMLTGREYLSPMSGPYDHYWPFFIKLAKKTILESGINRLEIKKSSQVKKINEKLYDFIGSVMIRVWYHNHPEPETY